MTASQSPTIENTAQTLEQTQTKVRAFILDKFPACRAKGLQDADSLIDSGIIDSMGILELVMFVESDFGISVGDMDLMPENFDSIAALSSFVLTKQGHS